MTEVENILFDFNGTLVDDLDLCLELLNTMLLQKGHAPVSRERYLEIFSFPVIEYYQKAGFVFPRDDFDELAKYFIDQYSSRNHECPLQEGAIETLRYLKNQGFRLAVVSASEIHLLNEQLKKYGISDYFDAVSGLDNINAGGKIESARSFMRRKRYSPDKTLMVGDTLHDGEVAKALGVRCVLIARGHQSYRRLISSGYPVLKNLKELIDIINKE